MKLEKILRKLWRVSPPLLRERTLEALCAVSLRRKPESRGGQSQDLRQEADTVCVAGFFRAPTGLGFSARLYAEETERAGKRVVRIDLTEAFFQEAMPDLVRPDLCSPADAAALNVEDAGDFFDLVIHVNPPMFLFALWTLRRLAASSRVIGFWAWELEMLPAVWWRCLSFVDAVEAPSSFTADAVRRHTRKSVSVHPHALGLVVEAQSPRPFAEDGCVNVLTVFDAASSVERKNPLAVIATFRKAFGNSSRARLTIRANKLDAFPAEAALLREAVKGLDSVRILSQSTGQKEVWELYRASDMYISLHRSEGYGLTLHEAMLYGLYVVGTGWSGNMDFMKGPKCFPVPYTLIPPRDARGLFALKGARWAEADADAAANILQEICRRESFLFE